jgi:PHP family Zn ribbon phosphoesterase
MVKKHLIDLHIHSNFSDGKLSIAEIVDLYGRKGFSAIAITDHLADSQTLTGVVTRKLKLSLNEKNMDHYLQELHAQQKRAREKYNMHLIAGVEITMNSWSRQQGAHIVFLNVDRYVDPNKNVLQLLKDNRNYFSIAAHPLWQEAYEFKTTYLWEQRHQLSPYVDAWECATAAKFSKEVYQSGYAYVSSSDFHGPHKFESWKMQTYVQEMNWEILKTQILNKSVEPVWI